MSDERETRLGIIGPCPPPTGGIGSHIIRLAALLDSQSIPYMIYNPNTRVEIPGKVVSIMKWRGIWLLLYPFLGKERCIYLHPQRVGTWLLGAIMQRFLGKRVMLCLHNMNIHNWCRNSAWKRRLIRWAVQNMFAIVCVNRTLTQTVLDLGVSSDRVFYLPSFLPPGPESVNKSEVCGDVWEFMGKHQPLLAGIGVVGFHKGEDLYGLDHMVELAARLKSDYPNLGIVVCFWKFEPQDQAYYDNLLALAREKGVEKNLLFNTKQGPFIPVLAEADVFVRPTNTDGDATSIREALALGVPAVVSDVVERPEGAMLFRTRDMDSFEKQVRMALNKVSQDRGQRTFVISEEDKKRMEQQVSLVRALLSGQLPD